MRVEGDKQIVDSVFDLKEGVIYILTETRYFGWKPIKKGARLLYTGPGERSAWGNIKDVFNFLELYPDDPIGMRPVYLEYWDVSTVGLIVDFDPRPNLKS